MSGQIPSSQFFVMGPGSWYRSQSRAAAIIAASRSPTQTRCFGRRRTTIHSGTLSYRESGGQTEPKRLVNVHALPRFTRPLRPDAIEEARHLRVGLLLPCEIGVLHGLVYF